MTDAPFATEARVLRLLFTVRCFEGPLDGTLVQIEVAGKLELPETFGEYKRDRTEDGRPKIDTSGNPAYVWVEAG